MVNPENLFTRDMIYAMHKELRGRIPNVNTPITTYAFDDMAVECRHFQDVRDFFSDISTTIPFSNILRTSPNTTLSSTTLMQDSPESPSTSTYDDTIEFPDSPPPLSPTTIEDHNPFEAPATTSSPTTRSNFDLKRTHGYYDYSMPNEDDSNTSDASDSSDNVFVHEIYPEPGQKYENYQMDPTASLQCKFLINESARPSTSRVPSFSLKGSGNPSSSENDFDFPCESDDGCRDDSSTSSTDDELHNINLPKLKKYKIDFFPDHHITYVLKEARSTVRATRPATTPAPPPFTRPSFQPINVPISIGSFVGYRRSISPSTKEYVVARVENILDFNTICEVKVLRRRTGFYDPEYIFYTFDVAVSEYTHRVDLVLLSVPLLHLYELEDTRRFVHKYIFHPNIEMDIENYFNSLNENTH